MCRLARGGQVTGKCQFLPISFRRLSVKRLAAYTVYERSRASARKARAIRAAASTPFGISDLARSGLQEINRLFCRLLATP